MKQYLVCVFTMWSVLVIVFQLIDIFKIFKNMLVYNEMKDL